jgi:hypothetical protein
MSLTAPVPYAVRELEKLGFKEWEEPFDHENIPSNLIDRAFNIEVGPITGITKENVAQSVEMSLTVRTYFKGFRSPAKARDEAIVRCDEIISDMINPSNFRNFSPPITGVFFDTGAIEPLDNEQNDNVVIAVLSFIVRIYICVE